MNFKNWTLIFSIIFELTQIIHGREISAKKSAVLGIGVYTPNQLNKLSNRFNSWQNHHYWDFSDWNNWRKKDGFLCRNTNDCKWIDPLMYCQNYLLDITPNVSMYGSISVF